MTVLVLTEDVGRAEVLAKTVASLGFTHAVAQTLDDALRRVSDGGIEVVLVDMPATDEEASHGTLLRAVAPAPVYVIGLTLGTYADARSLALRAGCDQAIRKPISRIDLEVALQSAVVARERDLRALVAADERREARSICPVTGLASQEELFALATAGLARAREKQDALALLLVDVEKLRRYNDEGTRALGNRVLSAVAEATRSRIRDHDVAGRAGDDEIGVLLSGARFAAAIAVADRILDAINALSLTASGRLYRPQVRVGIALFPSRTVADAASLFGAAERALVRARARAALGPDALPLRVVVDDGVRSA